MVKEESLTTRWFFDLLCAPLKVDFRMSPIPAPHCGCTGIRAIHQVLSFPDLIYLLFEGDHFEFTQAPNQLKSLHVERS